MYQKLHAIASDLSNTLIDRAVAIELALLALLTGEHLVLLGPPGTAKSLLVRELCNRITGGKYFERLLTKFSTPEELFGPLSLAALEQDQYRRVTGGTLIDCHIAFLDEIFKANSAILNSLLTLINERLYAEAGQVTQVPLLSLFGASNETPEDESLGALYDRFLLRHYVPYLTDESDLRSLFTMQPSAPQVTLTLDELAQAQTQVKGVHVSETTIDCLIALKRELEGEGIAASDRRWRSSVKLVQAKALMAGETATMEDHCEVMAHTLWSSPDQIRVVERTVHKLVNPLAYEAVELEDAARALYDQRPRAGEADLMQRLEPLMRQVNDIKEMLSTRIEKATGPSSKRARANQALSTVVKWQQELGQLALGSLSGFSTPATRS